MFLLHGISLLKKIKAMKKNILVISAHPDDEILGCGGTVSRLVREGNEAYVLILGEGITSRDEKREPDKRVKEIEELKGQIHSANKIIGTKEVFIHDFPDNRFDTVPLLDIVKVIEKLKKETRPDIIFTHYRNDLNIDHQIVYKAVVTSTRPLSDETVKEIYSYEVLSSTEWNYPLSFSPNVFFDISDTLEVKINAMNEYRSEIRESPHTRSAEAMRITSKKWGMQTGLESAEAFELVRLIR